MKKSVISFFIILHSSTFLCNAAYDTNQHASHRNHPSNAGAASTTTQRASAHKARTYVSDNNEASPHAIVPSPQPALASAASAPTTVPSPQPALASAASAPTTVPSSQPASASAASTPTTVPSSQPALAAATSTASSPPPPIAQDGDVLATNKYDIKVVFVPLPGRDESSGEFTLSCSGSAGHTDWSINKLKKNPAIIPAGTLKIKKVDLSDKHHNKDGKVIDDNGNIVPSGSKKSPDGFETYIDRAPVQPGIGCSAEFYTTGPNNTMISFTDPNVKAIVAAGSDAVGREYIERNFPNADVRTTYANIKLVY